MTPGEVYKQAEADYLSGRYEAARQGLAALPDPSQEAQALLALCRVRQALSDWPAGEALDPALLSAALAGTFHHPGLEADCLFARGWLHWLKGELEQAERLLEADAGSAPASAEAQAERAYWLARMHVLRGNGQAVAGFEAVLRSRNVPPRATAWLIDLLWRAGQHERAVQVWKTVRGNRKLLACDEAPLLEARCLLRHGDLAQAERVLAAACPRGGPAQVERHLLLAWILADRNDTTDQAATLQRRAAQGPYPAAALGAWQTLFTLRRGSVPVGDIHSLPPAPAALAGYVRGQQARWAGQAAEAVAAFREALSSVAARPFARYALACLGEDDFAAVLASQPGLFLALRCRARLALERFRRREASPAELLDQVRRAAATGYWTPAADHLGRLAKALTNPSPAAAELRAFLQAASAEASVVRRDALRVAVEVAVRQLPAALALELLLDLAAPDGLDPGDAAAGLIGGQLLRLLLREGSAAPARRRDALAAAARLLGPDPRPTLVNDWLSGPAGAQAAAEGPSAEPLARLWRAACLLGSEGGPADLEGWRQEVGTLRSHARLRGLAQAVLLQEAGRRGDVTAAAALLEERDPWSALDRPPMFVIRAVAFLTAVQPASPALRRGVAAWLSAWPGADLGPEATPLAEYAGMVTRGPRSTAPPAGVAVGPWLLHQAAQAIRQGQWPPALRWVRQSLEQDSGTEAARHALPELERLARAQVLAEVARVLPDQPAVGPEVLADLLDLLEQEPEGRAALEAATAGDLEEARWQLAALSDRPTLPARLAHHLAVTWHRAGLALDGADLAEPAVACWRLAWTCWLHFLAENGGPEMASGNAAGDCSGVLVEHLLGIHRRRVNELLRRNRVDGARRHWELVHELPGLGLCLEESRAGSVAQAVARFRDDLAAECLTGMRQAAQHGLAPPGWRAGYHAGFAAARGLLSLDRDNVRLLTALVEFAGEWLTDCYDNEDGRQMAEVLGRLTPFALHLTRLVAERPGELAARAALAEFCKFRGFAAPTAGEARALYHEALRLNPANDNVRRLLAQLEAGPGE
jgi:hypothetical protein